MKSRSKTDRRSTKRNGDSTDNLLELLQPSQWINSHHMMYWPVPFYLGSEYFPYSLIAFVPFIGEYIKTMFWKYELREMTIIERKGVFSVEKTETHYYRIKSVRIDKPWYFRIFGMSIIHIVSSDKFKPTLVLYGIKDGDRVYEWIQTMAYDWKREYGVTDYDLFQTNYTD